MELTEYQQEALERFLQTQEQIAKEMERIRRELTEIVRKMPNKPSRMGSR